tara:strand:- start:478 stop:897 length:420 start_codon:yes stop_codon:yes gene_type:complete
MSPSFFVVVDVDIALPPLRRRRSSISRFCSRRSFSDGSSPTGRPPPGKNIESEKISLFFVTTLKKEEEEEEEEEEEKKRKRRKQIRTTAVRDTRKSSAGRTRGREYRTTRRVEIAKWGENRPKKDDCISSARGVFTRAL